MHKLIKLVISLSLLISTNSFASLDEEKFFAGISINSNGGKLYLEYQDNEDEYSKIEKTKSPSSDFNGEAEDIIVNYEKKQILAYSGYQNVEGFKNNKRRDDWTFASIFTVAGIAILGVSAVTVNALIKAIN